MKVNENVDIIGLEKEINKLSSILEYNLLQDNNTQSQEIKFIKGMLIQGPSGTGKSFLVKYLSRKFEKQVSFFELKNSDLVKISLIRHQIIKKKMTKSRIFSK